MSDAPERSPTLLAPPPKRGIGVRRLNKLPIVFVIGGLMLVVGAIGYTYRDRLMQSAANAREATSHKPEPGSGANVLNGAPSGGEVEATAARTPGPGRPKDTSSPPAQTQPSSTPSDGVSAGGGSARDEDDATKARREAWQTYYTQVAQLQKDRLAAATSAMTADTGLGNNSGSQTGASGNGVPGAAGGPASFPGGVAPGMSVGAPGAVSGAYPGGFGVPTYPPARVDAGAQREKQAFLNQPGDVTGSSDDLQAALRDPSSPFLVMAGTAIPAVMIGGINSDMPGMVIGQVSENVYDTATGRYLLVPQGSRLIGSYDNVVAHGQTRVGVIWNRIIYPDTESIDLGSMEGADRGGYAGFHDQVDTHFWSKIGNALLISIASAGVQLSQPQAVNGQNYNSQQIAAAALGQQFGELGQEYARAGLSIPNTLEIRPGYRFVVMVNKDMHLRPYVDHRTMTGTTPVSLGPILQ
jgi:type IV secretory pathway VirB10-like protein